VTDGQAGRPQALVVHARHPRRKLDDCPSDLHRRHAQDRIRTSRPAPRGRRGVGGSYGAPPWTAAWFSSCCGAGDFRGRHGPDPNLPNLIHRIESAGARGRLRSFHTRHSPWRTVGRGLLGVAVPRGGVESRAPFQAHSFTRARGRMKSCLWIWPHFSRGFHIRVARVQIVRGSPRGGRAQAPHPEARVRELRRGSYGARREDSG
jgi:hypothetical protein